MTASSHPSDSPEATPAKALWSAGQEFLEVPADYAVTPADMDALFGAELVLITGPAIEMALAICEAADPIEAYWLWLARPDARAVICNVVVPHQIASGGFCSAAGPAIVRANLLASEHGYVVVAAGHNHPFGGLFSSGQDRRLMTMLAEEGLGHSRSVWRRSPGQVSHERGAAERTEGRDARPGRPDAPSRFVATFEDQPSAEVVFDAEGAEPSGVELGNRFLEVAVTFSTHTAAKGRGNDSFFPVHTSEYCACCGAVEHRFRADPVVKVVGPRRLSPRSRELLRKDVARKVRRSSGMPYWSASPGPVKAELPPAEAPQVQPAPQPVAQPAGVPYQVVRHGRTVARISPAVMEQAACFCPRLAQELGWSD